MGIPLERLFFSVYTVVVLIIITSNYITCCFCQRYANTTHRFKKWLLWASWNMVKLRFGNIVFLESASCISGRGTSQFFFTFLQNSPADFKNGMSSSIWQCFDTASANNLPPSPFSLSHRKLNHLPAVVAQPSPPSRSLSTHWATAATWRPQRSDPPPAGSLAFWFMCLHWHTIALGWPLSS